MKVIEAIGKNVDSAIASGLAQLGVSLDSVTVEVLDEGSRGVFGVFGAKMARVRLTCEGIEEDEEEESAQDALSLMDDFNLPSEEEEPAQEPAPRAQRSNRSRGGRNGRKGSRRGGNGAERRKEAPAPAVDYEDTYTNAPAYEHPAAVFLCEVAHLMGIPRPDITVEEDAEGAWHVSVEGEHAGAFIGHHGDALSALQLLTTLVVNPQGRDGDSYHRVILDVSGYRQRREETLVNLANRMAQKVLDTNEAIDLEPMSAYERRIIHTALSEHEGITTWSEGNEPHRHIVIGLKELEGDDLFGDDEDDEI